MHENDGLILFVLSKWFDEYMDNHEALSQERKA